MTELIYLDYTREELDRQYSNFLQEGAEKANDAATARCQQNLETLAPRTGISYGPQAGQVFDLYHPGDRESAAPAIVYMHGGQWQKGDATMSAVAADTCLAQGVALVAAHCTQIPEARLDTMVDQNVALVRHVRARAAEYCIDPARICVAGHSSGAHLAGAALVRLANDDDLAGITCGLLYSGNYDLRPLMKSYRADYLLLDDAETVALSPLLTLDKPLPPLWMAVGTLESDEFKRQGQTFHEAVSKLSPATLQEADGKNHFDANEDFRTAGTPVWEFLSTHLGAANAAAAQ